MPVNTRIANRRGIVPVGTIIPFYDFNGLLDFDTKTWAYCNGQVLADADSPLNGQTLPDLSGRYLVGFGTDGGGDIHTDPWATAAVGNSNHIINLEHAHTSSHVHTLNTHSHTAGSLELKILTYNYGGTHTTPRSQTIYVGTIYCYDGSNSAHVVLSSLYSYKYYDHGDFAEFCPYTHCQFNLGSNQKYYARYGTGNTNTNNDNTSVPTSNTSNALNSVTSIQPRSIRSRYIMRIA